MRTIRHTYCAGSMILMMATTTLADFETNWPAYNFPRQERSHLQQCYSGVVERVSVCYYDTGGGNFAVPAGPAAPSWYRSNYATLTNLKERVIVVITNFLSTNVMVDGKYTNYLNANPGSWALPTHTITGLLAQCQLPTNYFAYTPTRWLEREGSGGFTNDASVGHAYGWTNAYTLAGGSNFPGSRAAWYTSDYGVDGLKAVLSNLLWTVRDIKDLYDHGGGPECPWLNWNSDEIGFAHTESHYGYGYNTNWTAAQTAAIAAYHSNEYGGSTESPAKGTTAGATWAMELYSQNIGPVYYSGNLFPAIARTVEGYTKPIEYGTWDAQGDSVTISNVTYFGSEAFGAVQNVEGPVLEFMTTNAPPNWVTSGTAGTKGYVCKEGIAVIKWNFTYK